VLQSIQETDETGVFMVRGGRLANEQADQIVHYQFIFSIT